MKKVFILVEGQTEEAFIINVLQPHFISINIYLTPVLPKSGDRPKSGQTFKGGVTNYQKVKNDIQILLKDSNAIVVTTMLDYYRLPKNFPGYQTIPNASCYDRVRYLSTRFSEDINHRRFLPFITLHEFEALLFVSPQAIAEEFPSYNIIDELNRIRNTVDSPEEINGGQNTHPSAHLENLINGYKKVKHGSAIVKNIGLNQIRSECPHFNGWLQQLENLQ